MLVSFACPNGQMRKIKENEAGKLIFIIGVHKLESIIALGRKLEDAKQT
jgi:hypothetical protein